MADMNSAIYQIFKEAHPDWSDDQIQATVDGSANAPDASKQEVGNLLGVMKDSSQVQPTFPGLNSTPSSFDVKDSTHTVTQDGVVPEPDSVKPPYIPDLNPTLDKGLGAPAPAPKVPDMTPPPAPVAPVVPAPSSDKAPAKSDKAAPTDPLKLTTSDDKAARDAELEREKRNRTKGLVGIGLGSIADGLGNAAVAFGGKGSSTATEDAAKAIDTRETRDKEAFELKLKNDPNSDVSKGYRQMVLEIAPDMAKQPAFNKMTAQAIGEKLPLIDTMMKARAAKDAKEIGLAQAKSNKDLSLSLREDQQQDKLEQEYKQQLMSVRGDPNISGLEKQRDAAAQGYNLIRDSQTDKGEYNLSEPQLVELYGQLMTAMTGRGMTDSMKQSMDQATGKQKMASIATFIGMSPSATTKAIGDRLKHMSLTLGNQVQANIDKRMQSRILPNSGLHKDRAEPILKAGRGLSFQELVDLSDKRKEGGNTTAKPASDPMGLF